MKDLLAAQRAWVEKRYGAELASTLEPRSVFGRSLHSSVDGGAGSVYSYYMRRWTDSRPSVETVQHIMHCGEAAGPEGWSYPSWAKLPKPPRLVEVGKTVLVAGRTGHNGCRCVVEAARLRVAGSTPRNYRRYTIRCVDERCDRPRKTAKVEQGGQRNVRLIELPVTLEHIRDEHNTEARRGLIQLYGMAEYLKDSDAVLRSQDDWGKLWVLPQRNDEDLVMVEMVSPTPPHPVYFERVPPTVLTPLQGLAWQANMTPLEYASMDVET